MEQSSVNETVSRTLTYSEGGVEIVTLDSSPDLEEPAVKKSKITRQVTLTQDDIWISPKSSRLSEPRISSAISPNGSTPKPPIINGNLFQKGETWRSERDDYAGYYFRISAMRKNRKDEWCAVCGGSEGVKISMDKTFIGPIEAERLTKEWEKKGVSWSNLSIVSNPNSVLLGNDTNLLDQGKIPLKCLSYHDPSMDDVRTEILYEEKGKYNTVGYTLSYRFRSSSQPLKPLICGDSPVILSLFSGCGGLDLGFEKEGFFIGGMVEDSSIVSDTLKMNFSYDKIFTMTVRSFLEHCKNGGEDIFPKRGDFDHINSGCPCQGNSKINTGEGKNDEYNNRLVHDFVEAVRYFQPYSALFENVPGILEKKSKKRKVEHLQKVFSDLVLEGYQIRLCVLNASQYGNPQDRIRVIVFFVQKGYKLPEYPKATHGEGLSPKVTVGDTLSYLYDVGPTECGMIKLPDGTVVRDHELEGTQIWGGDDTKTMYLLEDKPAKTILKGNPLKHPLKERMCSIRERAELQSFPRNFNFAGKCAQKASQIGNAVPVELARAIAKTVMASYKLSDT